MDYFKMQETIIQTMKLPDEKIPTTNFEFAVGIYGLLESLLSSRESL